MRELKFRLRRIRMDGTSHVVDIAALDELMEYEHTNPIGYGVDQYTGLKDKNGKEIYEGDIVGFETHPELAPVPVGFEEGCFLFGVRLPGLWMEHYGLAIIGNIYENPELLEDDNERN